MEEKYKQELVGGIYSISKVESRIRSILLLTCPSLPTMSTVVPVYVKIQGSTIPLNDAIGNTLFSDQLLSGRRYDIIFGGTPSHFRLRHCSNLSRAVPTITTITAEEVGS